MSNWTVIVAGKQKNKSTATTPFYGYKNIYGSSAILIWIDLKLDVLVRGHASLHANMTQIIEKNYVKDP